jgi:ABC-2 type transport system permease protein
LDLLRGFGNFLLKELKELIRDPKILLGMIIVPLIMFPVLGAIMGFSVQTAKEKALRATTLILNNDVGTYYSDLFIVFLNSSLNVYGVNNTTPQQALSDDLLSAYNATYFIEIPNGFNDSMTEHMKNATVKAQVNYFSVFSGGGVFENIGTSIIDIMIAEFNRALAPDALDIQKSSIIKGEIKEGVDPAELSALMISQAIAMPITIMILLTYSMQIAATSVAMEKEEKTLETLLTLPMDRFAILMGKLAGSILMAGIGALTYMVGFNYYIGSFSSFSAGTNLDLAALGLVPSLFGYLLLGISLFVTLLSALALAVILSSFAEDVRSAQSMVGYIYPFIYLPSLALMYLDINALPLVVRIIICAIPYSHPIIASKAITMGDYWTAILGIVYVAVFTVVIMYVASRLFATEKILTAKLRFRGLRRGKKKVTEELQ